ncbi:MAG: glycoside hydrolase family 97 catalytic domain-containing protein [Bryobacteraceae bacterium]|nr:glycoside hydrolase family 97 catalytic domain-containing protein [Bryobacteraceae bacterium]
MRSPILPALVAACLPSLLAQDLVVAGPSGAIRFALDTSSPRLHFSVSLRGKPAVETSPLEISIDGQDLSTNVTVGPVDRFQTDLTYPWHGPYSEARDRSNGARFHLTHRPSETRYVLEVRVADDAVAFRHTIPGTGRRIPDEATLFRLPEGSVAWTHDTDDHYESEFRRQGLPAIAPGEWALPPLTVRLPRDTGFLAITEAALRAYSGMGLQADGQRGFRIRLGHAIPASYPFRLRYSNLVDRLSQPAAISGLITTPWRVVLLAPDLNTLVNSPMIHNLAPPPDPSLFPEGLRTAWIKPGRAVWSYLDGGRGTLDGMKEFSRLASDLGFEYNVLEGFWSRWPESDLTELTAWSRRLGVGIFLWKHSRDLRTPAQLKEFFSLCNRTGVVGAKIDFFDHEHKDIIDLYETILRSAAEHKLLIDFHGSNKPTGLERTWPNLVGWEGIRGMESRPPYAQHDATLPFTRMLAGLADYTPTHFGRRMADTTWAHQVANAILFPAPLLVYAAHPANILGNPTAPMIRGIPATWDQTVVLPPSDIGEVAVLARRKKDTWFIAAANGVYARTIRLDLSFLGEGSYQAFLIRDAPGAADVKTEHLTLRRTDSLDVTMPSGGGFVARFQP